MAKNKQAVLICKVVYTDMIRASVESQYLCKEFLFSLCLINENLSTCNVRVITAMTVITYFVTQGHELGI